MRVVVVGTRGFPNVQGGVETHCRQLYPALAMLGVDVTVFTRVPYVDPNLTESRGVKLIPVKAVKNKFLEAFSHTSKCLDMARELNPDIIHIHAIGPSFFASKARKVGRCKVVVTHHGPDYKRKKWPLPAKLFLRFCEWRGMKKADKIITLEQGLAGIIQKKFDRQARIIPNGVWIFDPTTDESVVKRFGLTKNRYIMAVGRLVPEKGFHDLVAAYEKVKDQLPEGWKVVICGSADHSDKYSSNLEKKAEKAGIVLTGYLEPDELRQIYSHAGLFILSSYYEGLPLVALEAMSYGIPYLMTDIKATKTLPLDKERLLIPGDIDELAAKLKSFTGVNFSEEQKQDMLKHVEEKYSWKLIAEQTLQVYKDVLAKNS